MFSNRKDDPDTQQIVDSHLGEIGVISFTEAIDNILMWSHYADSHKGMAIGFDPKHPFFKELERIRYTTLRPNLREEFPKIRGTELFFKSDQWMYEKEWRLTKLFSQSSHAFGLIKKNIQDIKNKNYFQIAFSHQIHMDFQDKFDENEPIFAMLQVPPEAIKSFTFGERVNQEGKKKRPRVSNLPTFAAPLTETKYY